MGRPRQPFRADTAVRVFGEDGASFVPFIYDFASQMRGFRYKFMPISEFQELHDMSRAMEIYWSEILQRAHMAAATSIMRTQRWLEGILWAADQPNIFSFAATFRGLIESASDTNDALAQASMSLASYRQIIQTALKRELA